MGTIVTRSFIVCVLVLTGVNASVGQIVAPTSMPVANKSAVLDKQSTVNTMQVVPTSENTPVAVTVSPILVPGNPVKSVASVQAGEPGVAVGTTWYDFQTNGSMAERLGFFQDGSERYLQVMWMASKDSTRVNRVPGFTNARGTHYNFVDVSDPLNPVATIENWKKIESANNRAGWPSVVQFADGIVGTPSHNSVFNGTVVKFFANGGPGDDVFFEFSQPTAVADTALWPRAAADGLGNVHLIYNRSLPDSTDQLAYRRSTDGGQSWEPEIQFTGASGLLPQGQTGTLPNGAGGDTYAITARGPNVVVAYSDSPLRIISRKSTDYGATWDNPTVGLRLLIDPNHTFIDSTEYTSNGIDSITLVSDTVVAPSSQIAVILDEQGRAHYAVGQALTYIIQKGLKDNSAAGSRSGIIYPVNDDALYTNTGIYYYRDGDSLIYTVGLAGGGSWDGQGAIISRRAYTGSSRYPQLGMDENENLYMVYTSVKTGDAMPMQIDTAGGDATTQPDTLIDVDGLYGHLYVTHRPANSMVWSAPKDITPDGSNCIFGTLCDNVTDQMYIAYSASAIPGDRVTSVETPSAEATIYVYPFPIAQLNVPSSVAENQSLDANVSVYPNPASDEARIHVQSVTPGSLSVSVVTLQGEHVIDATSSSASGSWDFTIPTRQLASGTYQIIIGQNGLFLTRSLNVVR